MRFRAEPEGDARLAADVVRAGDEAGSFILARIAGYSDEVAYDLWERGDRDADINAASSEP